MNMYVCSCVCSTTHTHTHREKLKRPTSCLPIKNCGNMCTQDGPSSSSAAVSVTEEARLRCSTTVSASPVLKFFHLQQRFPFALLQPPGSHRSALYLMSWMDRAVLLPCVPGFLHYCLWVSFPQTSALQTSFCRADPSAEHHRL